MASPPTPSDPETWRKKGYLFKEVPPAVHTHVRIKVEMSQLIRGLYLPHPKLSVINLATFSLPPMVFTPSAYPIPPDHNFFSEDANHSDLESLTTKINVPPPALIAQLTSEIRQRYLDGAESICIPWTGKLYPLWVVHLWAEFHRTVEPEVSAWAKAIKWLLDLEWLHPKEVKQTMRSLTTIAWTGTFPVQNNTGLPRSSKDPMSWLTCYLSRDWFSSRQIDQMVDLIIYDIKKAAPDRKIRGMTTAITTEILKQYSKSPRDYNPEEDHFLQRFGRSLQDASEFVGIFHVNKNHWVGAAVDPMAEAIEYGDPGGGSADDVDVCAALLWFTTQHLPEYFTTAFKPPLELPCTQQEDSHNCGLYAPNAIAHKFIPDEYPLFSEDLDLGDLGRLNMLRRVVAKLHEIGEPSIKAGPSIVTQKMHEYVNTSRRYSRSPSRSPSPSTPTRDIDSDRLSSALRQLSVSPRKAPSKRRRVDGPSDPSIPTVAPIFKKQASQVKVPGKKTVTKVADKTRKAAARPPGKKEVKAAAMRKHEEEALAAMPADAADQDSASTSGRPRSEAMDYLTVEVESDTIARAYRCAGPGCIKIFKPRSLVRVLNHTKRCTKLTSEQRQFASKLSAGTSPGARAEELAKGLSPKDLEPRPDPQPFFGAAGAKRVHDHYSALLDLAIVKVFAAAGLPPRLADYPEYKEIFRLAALAGRNYVPAGRTVLMDNHIMSEQECVRALQIAYLQTQTRLSVSYDGGDLRSGEDFYTVHANTAEGRSFLLEGFECTTVSHTADWMSQMVLGVMKTVGLKLFIATSSDGAGNARGCRHNIVIKAPTILDLGDPNHHLSLTCKDILLLPYFKQNIKISRGAIRHFKQSKQAKAMLKQLRIKDGIRGLETIGKTRFATITWASLSIRRNLNLIRTLCTNGQVEIKKYTPYFMKDSPKTLDYEIKLGQLIAVTEEIARAIQCLEAASCNCADVYLIWLAVTAHLQYVNSSIFKRPNAVAPLTITIPGTQKAPEAPLGVQNAKTFFAVAEYLFEQAVIEVEHGIDPTLIAFQKKKKTFSEQFKLQFLSYAQGSFPFNTPLGGMRPIDWWRALEGSPHGGIVASLALKFYSAVPHSMADERTVSVTTWMNPALRNLEKVNTIFSFAQIRGWYRDEAKQKALADGTAKNRAAAHPHPEVKFYNIEREIHSIDDDDIELDADDVDSDDEFKAIATAGTRETGASKVDWLDIPHPALPKSKALDLESGEVDLDSTLLQDVLADQQAVPAQGSAGKVFAAMDQDSNEEDDEGAPFELGSWT
ncbi:ribonuclease H-like domain-containing protein [Mycena galericulata]|nr:ribonuclease H-like domain-containing protein [Mycena galericulata]